MRMKHIAVALALMLAPQVAMSTQSKIEDSTARQLLEKSEQDLVRARQSGGVIGLGIRVQTIELEIDNIAIRSVAPNSPAAKAGLQEGDTVWMINKRLVDEQPMYSLYRELYSSKDLSLVIGRGVQEVEKGITLISGAPVTSIVVDEETSGTAEEIAHALKENLNATITGGPSARANELAQYEDAGNFVVVSYNQELLTIAGEEFSDVGEPAPVQVASRDDDSASMSAVMTPDAPPPSEPLTAADRGAASALAPLLFIVPPVLILCAVVAFIRYRKRNTKGGPQYKW